MARALSILLLLISFAVAGPGVSAQQGAGPAVLTISGDIGESNRAKLDPFVDGFLNYHDKAFKTAFELTLADLMTLPQVEIRADGATENWPKPVTLNGPLLSDVLRLAKAEGKSISVTALDGYVAELDASAQSEQKWILAHSMDGKPLSIGGRGPLWLARDTGTGKASEDELAKWVWSVFYIEVGTE